MEFTLSKDRKFETHITVFTDRDELVSNARAYAIKTGLKWTHISLKNGEHQSQPMITFWKSGSLSDQLAAAKDIQASLESVGVKVVRVKVECVVSDLDELFLGNESIEDHSGYFESHLKIKLSNKENSEVLSQFVAPYHARLSSNARRNLKGGTSEWFVTQRAYKTSRHDALGLITKLVAGLQSENYQIIESEHEYVLFDSNHDLDKGWI